jgi:hypothetical protein
VADCCTHL